MTRMPQGFAYNFKGARYFLRHRTLWKYSFIPFAINLLLAAFFVYLAVSYHPLVMDYFTNWMDSFFSFEASGFLADFIHGLFWFLKKIFFIVYVVLAFILILVVMFILSTLINAPFYEFLSEQVLLLEKVLPKTQVENFFSLSQFGRSLRIEFAKTVVFILITLALLVLSGLPGIGVIFIALQFIFLAWFFGLGICAYPLVFQKFSFRQIFSWGWQHKYQLIGFGLPSLIPFLSLLTMPFQVVGGTLLYRDLKKS